MVSTSWRLGAEAPGTLASEPVRAQGAGAFPENRLTKQKARGSGCCGIFPQSPIRSEPLEPDLRHIRSFSRHRSTGSRRVPDGPDALDIVGGGIRDATLQRGVEPADAGPCDP